MAQDGLAAQPPCPAPQSGGLARWSDVAQTRVVDQLTPVPLAQRSAWATGPFAPECHGALFDTLPALRQIERGGRQPRRTSLAASARLIFWNVERLRHLEAIAALVRTQRPDVLLISEVDRGMARTGNSDRLGSLSNLLGMGHLYAVEFVELGLGDADEQRQHASQVNHEGFHGAAILSDLRLQAPALVRLERQGLWFGPARGQPRIGGRIALLSFISLAGEPVLLANVHLESHGTPQERGAQMRHLLTQIEGLSPGGRVVIGGDFNTSTRSRAMGQDEAAAFAAELARDPGRLLRPEPHEPLFAEAAALGYDWRGGNLADRPTTRYPAGDPRPPAKIDWIFTRGLAVSGAAILPALGPDGQPISDHEALMLTIAPD